MKKLEVVAAIIKENDKYFTTQRGYGEYKGWWEFPGGKIENGESKEEALKREIREELATEIEIDRFITTVQFDYPEFHLIMHCFICHITAGQPQLLEAKAAKWLDKNDLTSVEWLPADRAILHLI
jgi:hypothetical protein BACCOPRO_00607